MLTILKIEARRLSRPLLVASTLTLISMLIDSEISPIIPYLALGFLLSSVFPMGISEGIEILLSKPFRRAGLFIGLLLSHITLSLFVFLPAVIKPISALYAVFALPFLPMGYLTAFFLKNPKKVVLVGTVIFLFLTFVPMGYIDMKAQDNAQKALGIETFADYEAKKAEYSAIVHSLEKEYGNMAFFSPGVQLELFARDVAGGDREDAFLRFGVSLGFTALLLAVSLLTFLRLEPGGLLRPTLPSLYVQSLPWWVRKEVAALWASRAFLALFMVLILPVEGTLKAFFSLFLLPLAVLEILSEDYSLILSKPVRRTYITRRFLVVSAVFTLFTPVFGPSFPVLLFTSAVIFLIGLFSRKLALVVLPFLGLLMSPTLQENSILVAVLFLILTLPVILLIHLRALRIELRGVVR
ncbi:hypothetical membrane protein [Thermococcus kodakarensis KOD1]|uniref:Hypothetical membrane protein n=1 Tax=Thermococcus kodakarensis (strain ATCC BAA-918 / JCM 12380 / KOD1) TaxID=69014 RepID=Q5JHX9_THEKO|nr:hypothetical protein [Thermococcus kodakarensis]WCN27918.1 hypothetical protein POG15_10475 [Thermococcus kodakarensis]WCN30217.1 hypothetical protein POG21_10460 [Thermococcus kodakarensis]BAD86245.1 hypothetical membrane protein [Thermococcus kodakarensis KOD1]